ALDEEGKIKSRRTPTSAPLLLSLCVFDRGLCGVVKTDGSIVVPPQFDWVGRFHEGRALVRSNGLYGYIDMNGRLVAKPQYALAGDYWHGFAEVDIGGKSALIDAEGHIVLSPEFARALPFGDNAFWVKDGPRRSPDYGGFAELVSNYDDFLSTQIFV